MATYYVNPDSSGGDGTTNATSGGTAAYASLNAALTARARNLVTATAIDEFICETGGTADTTVVAMSGWTTSSIYYIDIKTSAGHRHAGVWSTAKYRIQGGSDYNHVINVGTYDVRITGLQIDITSARTEGPIIAGILAEGDANVAQYFIGNIIRGTNATGGTRGIRCTNSANIWNNIIYDQLVNVQSHGLSLTPATGTTQNVYNNTVYGCVEGINVTAYTTGTLNLRNNLANGNTADYYSEGGYTRNSSFNISEDASSPDASYRSLAVTFANEASDDFHLGASDTLAKDAGTDLSGTFTTDIDGDTRSGTWDIGADEYSAGGSPPITDGPALVSVRSNIRFN
jgi:hypothetical protein